MSLRLASAVFVGPGYQVVEIREGKWTRWLYERVSEEAGMTTADFEKWLDGALFYKSEDDWHSEKNDIALNMVRDGNLISAVNVVFDCEKQLLFKDWVYFAQTLFEMGFHTGSTDKDKIDEFKDRLFVIFRGVNLREVRARAEVFRKRIECGCGN